MRKFLLVSCILAGLCYPACAGEPAADFLVRLFINACIPNMGRPAGITAWAEKNHLEKIGNPAALAIFVGDGKEGVAWAVPASMGNFALSIRGTTHACAVWAQAADPETTEANFTKIIEGVKRPGILLNRDVDKTDTAPSGKVRTLIYGVSGENGQAGFEFSMLTVENPGSAFQASIQVAPVTPESSH